jgi:opacity protein-like surface antigen
MFWRIAIPALAAFAALTATPVARAADMPLPPPVAEPCCSNWYLRSFVGVGMTGSNQIQFIQNPANASDFSFDHSQVSDTTFVGGAVGYDWNQWFRFDVSGEYRSKANVYAFGSYTVGCTSFNGFCLDTYNGNLKSWVFLANGYVDLGTWWCLTPFVGAGVGGAYNQLVDFTDVNPSVGGRGIGRNSAEWHMAYALYAGLAYNVSKNFKIDFTYRYLNYGSITDTIDCIGGCNPDSYKFGNLFSHDIMLGLRWTCCDVEQPRYVYTPPLRSKG